MTTKEALTYSLVFFILVVLGTIAKFLMTTDPLLFSLFLSLSATVIIVYLIHKFTTGAFRKILYILFIPSLICQLCANIFGKEIYKSFIIIFSIILSVYFLYVLWNYFTTKPSTNENQIDFSRDEINSNDYNGSISNTINDDSVYTEKISIDTMTGLEFEKFCATLLAKNNFTQIVVTPASGDQGVDVTALKDEVKYAIQCKHYSYPVGNTPIQEVTAGKAFHHCHIGVVLTNSYFTKGAKDLAKVNNVILWDRKKLYELINNAGLKDKYQ